MSMSDIAININNVSKKYLIGSHNQRGYTTLREQVAGSLKSIINGNLQGQTKEFWALKDIDLTIEKGDKVALIGHNGAGKSTLLKILSQVTGPTTGQITLNGKVSSLLEVGTGFHPELTGRENIYLNGSIMGMSKEDITRQLDSIVEFSGVENFLHTPVKRYSSGMQARLGFAVAAHLQSDILIVDEVLAVGDAAFQKKCLGKMDEVSKKTGKTILFVSHNLHAVRALCNRGVLLKGGSVLMTGDITAVCDQYSKDALDNPEYLFKTRTDFLDLIKVDAPVGIAAGQDWSITLTLRANVPLHSINVDFSLYNREILPISHVRGRDLAQDFDVDSGEFSVKLTTKGVSLNNGDYLLGVYITDAKGNVLLDVLDIPAGTMHNAPSYVSCAALISNQAQITFEA